MIIHIQIIIIDQSRHYKQSEKEEEEEGDGEETIGNRLGVKVKIDNQNFNELN